MSTPRRPRIADPEFDPSPVRTIRLRDFDAPEHQRLVVNPFLAVLGLIGLWQATALLAGSEYPLLAIVMVLPLAFLPYLVQYHCLDCGRTGPYLRRRRHSCEGVVSRWRDGHPSRFPLPSTWAQLVFWGWVLGSIAVLLAVEAST